jgi:tight adherence protein C
MLDALRTLATPIAALLAFSGVLLAVLGMGMPARRDPIEERLIQATQRSRTLEEIEMQASFTDRFLKPLSSQMAKVMSRLTPATAMETTQKRLMYAGLSARTQVSDYMGMKGLAIVIGIALAMGLGLRFNTNIWTMAFFILLLGAVGYFGPDLWLREQISQRKLAVTRALPDAIDLLTISVEAGLGFDQALARVVSKSDNALTREFARVIQEMRIGVARRDALRAMVERTGVEDLSSFISAIIQAEQLGASVANVLRIQAVEMRLRRRQYAERQAQLAPIKMLFPMAFLIFPPIFIVVLGPAIPNVIHAFAPGVPM